uniref:General transcription factor 3C polypeptide 3-like n=1 Tax=Saccoglossus kowalevskii TaxID=10224 RepID=A0ABM0M6R8_SACKO|nr:PREDICTED: general transcription factor 3C polypeptide 3-like [Saccoglossus kowalevskii]
MAVNASQEDLLKYLQNQMTFDDFNQRIDDSEQVSGVVSDEPQPSHSGAHPEHNYAQNQGMHMTSDDDEEEEDDDDSGDEEEDGEEDVSAFEVEMRFDREQRKQQRKMQKRRNRVPKALRGLMGEANLRFARSDHEDAIKMCMEIIRQAPSSYEPFQLLGMIYEDKGDIERSLQFSLIAAHLSPRDVEEWIKLAEMSLEQDNIKQAILCYSKDYIYCWRKMIRTSSYESGRKTYHRMGDTQQAIDAMQKAVENHPDLISSEDVNISSELCMSMKQYDTALQILCRHCGVVIQQRTVDQLESLDQIDIHDVIVPAEIPIDLRIKLAICLLHTKHTKPIQTILAPLFEESPDEMGDLYLDIAEAYIDVGMYKEAKPILALLVNSEKYNLAAVWLRYAECVNCLGELQLASVCYHKVIKLAPSHLEARLALSAIEQQLGHTDQALQVLSQDISETMETEGEEEEVVLGQDIQLLHHKCRILQSQSRTEEFIENALLLMAYYFKDVKPEESLREIFGKISHKKRRYYLQKSPRLHRKIVLSGSMSSVTKEEWWSLYYRLCETLRETKQFKLLEELAATGYASTQFAKEPAKIKELDYICLLAHYFNHNYRLAYNFIRPMIMEKPESTQLWNLFAQIILHTHDSRHNKFCLRLMLKHSDNLALCILNGHNAFLSGSLKHALGEYVRGFSIDRNNAMLAMCIGLTFMQMASQKYAVKRHSLIVQGFAFLQRYLDMRGECQESYYNLGRAFHQLGLVHLAIHYYKKSLSLPKVVDDGDYFDLRKESAYNLSLIYQSSGSFELAREMLLQHCVV